MPLSYIIYGSVGVLIITLVLYLLDRKRKDQ